MRTKVSPLTRITCKNGQVVYRKKINGKQYQFGSRGCSEKDAIADYMSRRDGIYAGSDPKDNDDISLEIGINRILHEKKDAVERGERSLKHYRDHADISRYILTALPRATPMMKLGPPHYAKLRAGLVGLAPMTQKNRLARIRAIFRRAVKLKYMVEIDDADELKAPPMRLIRLTRPKHEILEPNQLRALVEAASPILKAVTFLGLNAAYINVDCCRLTLAEARQGVKVGFLLGQRVKTGVDRCAVLWPETKAALQVVIDAHAGTHEFLFIRKNGLPYLDDNTNQIARDYKKLTEGLGITLTFARLRHFFQTIAEERTLDAVAVRHVMGHADHSISQVYRDRVLYARIEKACNAVRDWYLTPEKADQASHSVT